MSKPKTIYDTIFPVAVIMSKPKTIYDTIFPIVFHNIIGYVVKLQNKFKKYCFRLHPVLYCVNIFRVDNVLNESQGSTVQDTYISLKA